MTVREILLIQMNQTSVLINLPFFSVPTLKNCVPKKGHIPEIHLNYNKNQKLFLQYIFVGHQIMYKWFKQEKTSNILNFQLVTCI